MNIVLAGNPNAGKTTLFNALTKSRLKTGNFHGVTTTAHTKKVGDVSFTDSPGLYSFNSYTMEEDEAASAIRQADAIINVVDSTTLQNSLNLTKKLISLNKNTVVYLTKLRELKVRGGWVNEGGLEKFLGVPVYSCSPRALKKLALGGALCRSVKRENIGLNAAYYGGNHAIRRYEKPFYSKFFAPLIFVAVISLTFLLTFHPAMPGAIAKDFLEELICVKLAGFLSAHIQSPVFASFFCEGVLGGVGGVLSFIPQLALLWLALILLDESGAMSALCFAADGLFAGAKLSGRVAFSLISGLGCTAAAITTTRGFSKMSSRVRTIAILPYVPCGAKLPVFLTFLSPVFKNPFPAVLILYFLGVATSIALSLIIKGEGEGLISEITPITAPRFSAVKNKLCFELKSFIIKVTGVVATFCMALWLCSHLTFSLTFCQPQNSIACHICRALLPLFAPMGVSDWRLIYAFLSGFAAKENIAATISMLSGSANLPAAAALACCVFVLACPACISAFASSVREVGFAKSLKFAAVQLAFAFAAAYITHFLFSFA